jgi:hypothetical protein
MDEYDDNLMKWNEYHDNLMNKADNLQAEVKEVNSDAVGVIREVNAFLVGIREVNAFPICRLMYSCSKELAGVYKSPGNQEMSHDEKRLMSQKMLYKCIEDILKVPSDSVFSACKEDKDYYKYNTAMTILNERALNLNDSSLSHGGLAKVLEHYSNDIENLADYILTFRDLNINGDTDLGDNDKKLITSDSSCGCCDGPCRLA